MTSFWQIPALGSLLFLAFLSSSIKLQIFKKYSKKICKNSKLILEKIEKIGKSPQSWFKRCNKNLKKRRNTCDRCGKWMGARLNTQNMYQMHDIWPPGNITPFCITFAPILGLDHGYGEQEEGFGEKHCLVIKPAIDCPVCCSGGF